jgi:hypothetical protein
MRSKAYWLQLIAIAFVVMVTGYWLMTAFTFTLPAWLVVLASTLSVLLFADWRSGRLSGESLEQWIRPVSLVVFTLVGYGVLTKLNFLPSSALFLAVLASNVVLDIAVERLTGRHEQPSVPLTVPAQRTTAARPSLDV